MKQSCMIPRFPSMPLSQPVRHISRRALFGAFFKIGLLGFGGVTGWVRPILVEERGWLDDREFAELLGLANVLPGANTVNLAALLGDRHQGLSGALSAIAGLLMAPLLVLVGIVLLYDRFGALADVNGALGGAAAATAGLVIGNAGKMLHAVRADFLAVLAAGAVFLAIGIFQLSFVTTLAILVPASLFIFAAAGLRS